MAPAFTAAWTVSAEPTRESMTTRVEGTLVTIRSVAVMPDIPGIATSMTTSAGWSENAISTACLPSPASKTA